MFYEHIYFIDFDKVSNSLSMDYCDSIVEVSFIGIINLNKNS